MTTPTHSVLLNSGSGSSVANLMGKEREGEEERERGGGGERERGRRKRYDIGGGISKGCVVKGAWLPQALERYILPRSLVPCEEHCHLKGRDL